MAKKRPGQQNCFTLCVVWQSPCLNGLQSSFIIWTLLRSSFKGCNPELGILSSLKLLHSISCSFDGDLFLSQVQYQFLQVDHILLVQGFRNGASTKTIAGKLFGRRRVKWWLFVLNLSDARHINQRQTEQENVWQNLSSTWENTIFNIHLKTWAMWFSNLFIVFSFRFIQLIASCRQSSRAHYRTLTGSIVRKLLCQSLTKNPRALSLCATDVP